MSSIQRRTLIAGVGALGLAAQARAAAPAQPASRAAGPLLHYPFSLLPLPYAADANEPAVDTATMQMHHDKHHAAYVANLNAALANHPALQAVPLHEMLANLSGVPEPIRATVRNNGGGHVNHSMFWQVMGGKGGGPNGAVLEAIDRDLGGMDALRTAFNRMGLGQFGSGWVFVTADRAGKLALAARPNQDTPIMDGGRVLFGNDVWEHAYYLKYQNRRADYLQAWWTVLNWQRIGERYAEAKSGVLAA